MAPSGNLKRWEGKLVGTVFEASHFIVTIS